MASGLCPSSLLFSADRRRAKAPRGQHAPPLLTWAFQFLPTWAGAVIDGLHRYGRFTRSIRAGRGSCHQLPGVSPLGSDRGPTVVGHSTLLPFACVVEPCRGTQSKASTLPHALEPPRRRNHTAGCGCCPPLFKAASRFLRLALVFSTRRDVSGHRAAAGVLGSVRGVAGFRFRARLLLGAHAPGCVATIYHSQPMPRTSRCRFKQGKATADPVNAPAFRGRCLWRRYSRRFCSLLCFAARWVSSAAIFACSPFGN